MAVITHELSEHDFEAPIRPFLRLWREDHAELGTADDRPS